RTLPALPPVGRPRPRRLRGVLGAGSRSSGEAAGRGGAARLAATLLIMSRIKAPTRPPRKYRSSPRQRVRARRVQGALAEGAARGDRKSTRLNSSHRTTAYAVF